MWGLGKQTASRLINEWGAEEETERVFHEAKQVLRLSGVPSVFRAWAALDRFFPIMWDAMRPNVETRTFEEVSDHLRATAVRLASRLGKLGARPRVWLGQSQSYHLQGLLDFYHYADAKLLLFASAMRRAIETQGTVSAQPGPVEFIERGVPSKMLPLELAAEDHDPRVRRAFAELEALVGPHAAEGEYRSIGLWPNYLLAVSERLIPILRSEAYIRASNELFDVARDLIRVLPYPIALSRDRLKALGQSTGPVLSATASIERGLPGAAIQVALMSLEWRPAEVLVRSPFPAATRRGAPAQAAQAPQAAQISQGGVS
jgi:hypothetical protein